MVRFYVVALLVACVCAVARGDTLVLKDGRQYRGIITKNGRTYTVYIGKREISIADDEVEQWVKGDARVEKPAIKPKPPTGQPAVRPKKGNPKTIDALQRNGREALAAGAYRVGRNAYFDWLLIDPADPDALEGAGLAYMGLGDPVRAKDYLEKGLTNAGASSRSLVLNTALANLRLHNPARSAKILRDFLVGVTGEDTRALDLMELALGQCDAQTKRNHVYTEARAFATQYEDKLKEAHPGMRRWGPEWLPEGEVVQREKAQKAEQKDSKKLESRLAREKRDVAEADTELVRLQVNLTHGLSSQYAVDKQKREVDRVRAIADETEAKLSMVRNAAMSASASAAALEPLLPGGEGATIAVAGADPPKVPEAVAVATPAQPETPSPAPTPAPAPPPTPAPSEPATPAPSPEPVAMGTRKFEVVDYAAGFPVAPDLIITDAAFIENATTIRVQGADGTPTDAVLLRKDDETGLALLRVPGGKLRYVILDGHFPGGAINCVGYPTVDLFNPSAELIPGAVATPGANWSVRLDRHPRLAGGPLIDTAGRVVGIELATRDSGTGQIRAATVADMKKLLGVDAPAAYGNARAIDVICQITATHEK